jgi:LDH2 family malate/lactate/ureidoglycolate dehydrogenase
MLMAERKRDTEDVELMMRQLHAVEGWRRCYWLLLMVRLIAGALGGALICDQYSNCDEDSE